MEIEILEPHGFCAGVSAALEKARRFLESSGGVAYCLHGIVHNEMVVAGLREAGMRFVDGLGEAPDGASILFSAHGVSPSVRAEAARRGMRIGDATCPFVARVHAAARAFAERGMSVVVVGRAGHAEVDGITGEAPGSRVVGSVAEARCIELPPGRGVGVVCQTTFDREEAEAVCAILAARFGAERAGGVCGATRERQDAVRAFGGDALLVLGSRASSNTLRLCEAARCRTFLAGTMDEVAAADFSGVRHLGVTSGASTPESFFAGAVSFLVQYWGSLKDNLER